MELWRKAANPWGQEVLIGVSWDLVWLALGASILFVVGHTVWVRARGGPEVGRATGEGTTAESIPAAPDVPERVSRHSLGSRAFHWTMAVAMFALLITAFVPVLGLQFAWVEIHWIAGLLLVATIVYHVLHVVGWQDFWSVWIGREDVRDGMAEARHVLNAEAPPPPRPGKYPADQKLYHHLAATASLVAIGTGLLMMVRIDTPLFGRNPYLLSDAWWGVVYVLHGLSGVALIGLVTAHVYFAVRPEKRWMTWSMIRGWITRDEYLEHFDPERWPVTGERALEAGDSGTVGAGAVADGAPRQRRGDG